MRKITFAITILVLLVVSFGFVAAKDPKISNANNGLEIRSPGVDTYKFGEDVEFAFHIDSKETGISLIATDTFFCDFHFYNNINEHLFVGRLTQADLAHDYDIEFIINSGNFTYLGDYWYNIYCECDSCAIGEGFTDLGGWERETIMITEDGKEASEYVDIFMMILVILIFGTACLFLYLSETMGEVAFKIFFLLLAAIFLMAAFITTYMILTNASIPSSISSTTLSLVYVLGAILIILFIYFLIRQTINALDLFRIKRGHEWSVGAGSKVGGYNTKRAY